MVFDTSRLGRRRIGDFVVEQRLPTIRAFRRPSYLMTYGVHSASLWPRAAVFIDKILKGAAEELIAYGAGRAIGADD